MMTGQGVLMAHLVTSHPDTQVLFYARARRQNRKVGELLYWHEGTAPSHAKGYHQQPHSPAKELGDLPHRRSGQALQLSRTMLLPRKDTPGQQQLWGIYYEPFNSYKGVAFSPCQLTSRCSIRGLCPHAWPGPAEVAHSHNTPHLQETCTSLTPCPHTVQLLKCAPPKEDRRTAQRAPLGVGGVSVYIQPPPARFPPTPIQRPHTRQLGKPQVREGT
jgi:hypothetical protein